MQELETRRVDEMHDALGGFADVVRGLADDDYGRRTGCPGWDVRAVVSHVIGVESLLTGGASPDVDVPEDLPHVRDEAGRFMERDVIARRDRTPAQLRDELAEVVARRREQLAGDLSTEVPTFFGQTAPLARTLGMRVFDIWVHEQDVRRAVGRPGHLDGPAPAAASRRMLRGLAQVLPDRLDGPGIVVVDVVGAQPGRLALDLDSGEAITEPAGDPTVLVRLDFADMVPLMSGRDDAADPATVAQVEGDERLAATLLASLSITP